jgi:nitrogenase molybdenum-iron protein NifN
MRAGAEELHQKAGVPYRLFDHLTGLEQTDSFVAALIEARGSAPPDRLKRERSRLLDAMLDGHFHFEDKRVAVAAEPDLLLALTSFLAGMGATIQAAVAPVASPSAGSVPAPRVVIGDLDDLERAASGCDLVVANSHARDLATRLGAPLFRAGFPVFDRLGGPQRVTVGYRGTRQLIFELANLLMDHVAEPHRRAGRFADSHRKGPPACSG